MKNLILLVCLFISINCQGIPPWLKIGAADAGGAFSGACGGSVFGPWGTGGGAVIGGVCASILEARTVGTTGGTVTPEIPALLDNPSSYVGTIHNQVVADFYKKNQPYVFGTVKNSTIQIAQAANKNIDFSKLDMNTIDKNAAAIGATDFDDAAALIKLLTAGLKSPQSITFAQNAVNSLYKSTTIAEFNASIMTIQGTLNSKTITNAADLATLQPFIATFYYSANFWAIPTR